MIIGVITIYLLFISCENYNINKNYTNIFNSKNISELRKHFLLDDPNGDVDEGTSGSDPTGAVEYSFMFEKDKDGNIIPNENVGTTWQKIPENVKLISDDENGIKLDDKIINGLVGATRLISKKIFKGGLFIFDI